MSIENITGGVTNAHGCPQLSSRELLEISREVECRNYWHSDNSFPASTAVRTNAKLLELQAYMDKRVAPIAFGCPCKPGEPIDLTQGGTIQTMGFAYYKNWVALDPCEVNEEVVCMEDNTPYERVPYLEKYRRHVAAKTAALTEAVRTRYELMATFLKLWGSYRVDGPKMDSYFVDFQRNPCLTAVLKRNYDDINTFPMNDLQHFFYHLKINSTDANGRGGAMPARIIMGVDAWYCFSNHHQVIREGFTKACDCTEPGNDLGITSEDCGVEFAGRVRNIPVFVDGRTYMDVDGSERYYMPQDAMLIEAEGMNGRRAHSTIYSPSANFEPGDFHFREYFCEPDEVWNLTVEGSILMFPGNVNRALLIRNVGRTRTFPGCTCQDALLNAEGQVVAPPKAGKGLCGDSEWEAAMKKAMDNEIFAVCAALIGRTPPQVPCNNGTKANCVPGKWCQIVPSKDPCPTAPRRCIAKSTLIEQGFDDYMIAEMVYYGGLDCIAEGDECIETIVTPPIVVAKNLEKVVEPPLKQELETETDDEAEEDDEE